MLTAEQLEARKNGIGGSDAAAVVGLNPYKTPMQVYMEKRGLSEPTPMNDKMYFGQLWEETVASEYARRCNKEVEIELNTLQHPKFKWMLANIDRRIKGENAILECKISYTPGRANQWGEPGTDEMPANYLLQCAHYAAVCDVERVDLAVILQGEFKLYRYHRNQTLESKLISKEEFFWNEHIVKNIPPAFYKFSDALMQWSQETEEKSEIATEEIEDIYYQICNRRKIIKEADAEIVALKTILASHMKDASYLYDTKGQLLASWKTQKRKGFYVEPSQSRVFKLKES